MDADKKGSKLQQEVHNRVQKKVQDQREFDDFERMMKEGHHTYKRGKGGAVKQTR